MEEQVASKFCLVASKFCQCGRRLDHNEWKVCRKCVQDGVEVDHRQNTIDGYTP